MSRIGKKIITIPQGTEVNVTNDILTVKGPLGTLTKKIHPLIEIRVTDNTASVHRKRETLESNALWGTFSSHLNNMIKGVNAAFEKKLILEGIGYKSEVKGDKMFFSLGFSHPVEVLIPNTIKVTAEKNNITVSGPNKEEVGLFASKLRMLKKPEPYKGKGMRYHDEVIRRKQGKKST